MNLKLNRPIAFLDLETTGINVVTDRIVEIGILKINPDSSRETRRHLVNPSIPIPISASQIHKIYDVDVEQMPYFKDIAHGIYRFIEGCDLAGYNSNHFDFPLLAEEFLRVGIDFDKSRFRFVDVQVIFHKMEKRTLEAAYTFYCKQALQNAHSALADATATLEVLESQLDMYPDLENNIAFLSQFSAHNRNVDYAGRIILDENDVEVFNFGKYKGKAVEEVLKKDPGFYGWMIGGEFPLYTKKVLTAIRTRSFGK
jgi:DNA polymerase-3 subunit epsilon